MTTHPPIAPANRLKKFTLFIICSWSLAGCMSTPATAISPTNTAMPPITATKPTPSETPIPTAIPVTPTSESAQIAEYLAATENSFPIQLFDGLGEFFGNLDFRNIIYINEKSPDGGKIGSYCIIRDGGVNFIAPSYLETDKFAYITFSMTLHEKRTDFQASDSLIKVMTEDMIRLLNLTGKSSRVRLLIGDNPASVFKGTVVPYADIFASSDWDEATLEFMQTGKYKLLPIKTVNGITGYFLPAIRISVADSVTATP